MTIDNVLEILEKHKLHIPSNVFYELKADIVNFEEPTTKNDLGVDCIDRNSIKYYPGTGGYMYASKGEIDKLPSVTPQEPRTGHWIYIGNSGVNGLKICKCSNCKKKTYGSHKFCPNCGAKMESKENENG